MSDAVTAVSAEIEGKEISFETGKLAKQASGAVVVRAGDTMVLCTATWISCP
jgi:polyribonucleotide nucleotidyltransferase